MEEKQQKIIYHPDNAIQLASQLPNLIPVRLFSVLYPLWQIEIDAEQEWKRPYALIEQYIERGIYECQLQTAEEMAEFFGLSVDLIHKILSFLDTIQHVRQVDGRWELTERGIRSLSEGTKHIVKQEKGQYLYFDGFRMIPLLKDHYKHMQVLPDEEVEIVRRSSSGGHEFRRLYSKSSWNLLALDDLIRQSQADREKYNVPPESQAITFAGLTFVYIPMYIVEMRQRVTRRPQYVVYTHVKGFYDEFFVRIVNSTAEIHRALDAFPKVENLFELWSDWLRRHELAILRPEQTSDGLWRVALPISLFQSLTVPATKIGTYYKERGYFLQIWCNDASTRRQAVLEYTFQYVKKYYRILTPERVDELLQQRSELLAIARVHLRDLHLWVKDGAVSCEEAVLQKLASWCQEKST
jgi:hypothetical protein